MNAEVFKAWLEKLRSGNYKQVFRIPFEYVKVFHDGNIGYHVLGLLGEGESVQQEIDRMSAENCRLLMQWSDNERRPFWEIADLLEAHRAQFVEEVDNGE